MNFLKTVGPLSNLWLMASDWRNLGLKRDDTCSECGYQLVAGATAQWSRSLRATRCLSHATESWTVDELNNESEQSSSAQSDTGGDPTVELEVGTEAAAAIVAGVAGASASAEFHRRSAKREQRVKAIHPVIGGFLLKVFDDPQTTKAWAIGAVGESKIGARLNALADQGCHVLHDRRIPLTKGNMDHIVVSSSGVYVIDAKNYKGRVKVDGSGGLFAPRTYRLVVGGRDCTKLVHGVHKQLKVVQSVLADAELIVPTTGVLSFWDADWPLFASDMVVEGVHIEGPKSTVRLVTRPGQFESLETRHIAEVLLAALPPAT